jgi:hypothetical protein
MLAQQDDFIRGSGGELFILNPQSNYNITPLFIVYKLRGDFVLMHSSTEEIDGQLYEQFFQKRNYGTIHFPVAEVVKIHSFYKISDRVCRKLGLRHYDLPYYRIRTTDDLDFFDQTGKGKFDR